MTSRTKEEGDKLKKSIDAEKHYSSGSCKGNTLPKRYYSNTVF